LRGVIVPQIAEIFHVTPQQRHSQRSNRESINISIAYLRTGERNRVTNCWNDWPENVEVDSYLWNSSYLWNNGYLWNQSAVAPASAPTATESWNAQEWHAVRRTAQWGEP